MADGTKVVRQGSDQFPEETIVIMSSTEASEPNSQTSIETLIRYIEVWIPTEDRTRLRLQHILINREQFWHVGYDSHSPKRDLRGHESAGTAVASARTMHGPIVPSATEVESGEGVAGRAWHQKSATILQEDPSEVLNNASRDCGVRLAAILAIPVLRGQEICGVVVLGCGDGFGAAEIWNRDDRDELAVSVSHYSGLPSFEFISRYTRFPKGAGVPGSVWKSGRPRMAQNLGSCDSFIRSFGNDPALISAVVGLPIGSSHGFAASVLLLLSSRQTPLARHVELWDCATIPPPDDHSEAHIEISRTAAAGSAPTEYLTSTDNSSVRWQEQIRTQLTTFCRPTIIVADDTGLPGDATFCLAVPIFRNTELTGVLNLMF